MVLSKALLAFLSFLAAVLFLALAVFSVSLGSVPLVDTGLLCVAIGLAFQASPLP